MDPADLRRGEKMMRRMLGKQFTDQVRRAWRALEPEFERYVVGFLAGEIWARPRLPLKIRSLVTVAALAALGKKEGLALNIRMALNNGATRDEVLETLLQLAPYAGFPTAWEALVVAGQVFQQMSDRSTPFQPTTAQSHRQSLERVGTGSKVHPVPTPERLVRRAILGAGRNGVQSPPRSNPRAVGRAGNPRRRSERGPKSTPFRPQSGWSGGQSSAPVGTGSKLGKRSRR